MGGTSARLHYILCTVQFAIVVSRFAETHTHVECTLNENAVRCRTGEKGETTCGLATWVTEDHNKVVESALLHTTCYLDTAQKKSEPHFQLSNIVSVEPSASLAHTFTVQNDALLRNSLAEAWKSKQEILTESNFIHLKEEEEAKTRSRNSLNGIAMYDEVEISVPVNDTTSWNWHEIYTPFDDLEGVKQLKVIGKRGKPEPYAIRMLEMNADETRAELEKAIQEEGALHDWRMWNKLSLVWRHSGNVYRAVQCTRRAVYLGPVSVEPVFNLATMLRNSGHYNDASAVLEASRFLHPNDTMVLMSLGEVYMQLKNFEKAVNTFEHTYQLDKHAVGLRSKLASAKRMLLKQQELTIQRNERVAEPLFDSTTYLYTVVVAVILFFAGINLRKRHR